MEEVVDALGDREERGRPLHHHPAHVGPAIAGGPAPLIDDDLAYVDQWGCDPATITAPVLLVHGSGDLVVPSAHSEWLARHVAGAQLRVLPGEGHISVLPAAAIQALEWLAQA